MEKGNVEITFKTRDGATREIKAVRAIIIFEEDSGKIQTVGECNLEFLRTLQEISIIDQAMDHAVHNNLAQKSLKERYQS